MSFSSDIKTELSREFPEAYHCLIAETAAIILFAGTLMGDPEQGSITVETENVLLAKKFLRLIRRAFDISVDLKVKKGKTNLYRIVLYYDEYREAGSGDKFSRVWHETADWEEPGFGKSLLEYSCCRRAFIRGAFMASGSMSNPGKSYHFEIVCADEAQAGIIKHIAETFDISPGIVKRKNKYIVYLKDSEAIVDMLGIMGAGSALMKLENVRIIKDMKNSANRQSNCDAANINKTVRTARKQVEDIRLIEERMGLDRLDPALREMAEARLAHPEESLKELGDYLDPPVGKSGVNHRLKKLSAIADSLRKKEK
ncbi:MAG: DNA-binding protein WhiA [Clostridiales bacterium]|nr:DNA-binding protein WhiA [Clostridiales bacterium]